MTGDSPCHHRLQKRHIRAQIRCDHDPRNTRMSYDRAALSWNRYVISSLCGLETLPSQLPGYTLLCTILSTQNESMLFYTCACRVSQAELTVVKIAESRGQIDQTFSIRSFPAAIACQEYGIAVLLTLVLGKSHVRAPTTSRGGKVLTTVCTFASAR